jgi:UDP-glucose 4-epimerase
MKKEHILVVGGAGYIGSHVNKMLEDEGYYTIVIDNLSTGSKEAVTRGKFIYGDMANTELLDAIFSSNIISAVMHFAAFIDVGESVFQPLKYYSNNVSNTLNLLNAMQRHGVKRFIFSSTAAIFGIPEEKLITEFHPTHPINPYGNSKLMVERILHDFDTAYGIKSSCLRYFNAAGGDPDGEVKNHKKKESNLIPILLRSLKHGDQKVTIFGEDYQTPDGTCIRDYIHICDLGAAHISAMEHLIEGRPSSRYNLGNGRGFSVREVINAAEKVTGIKPQITIGPRRAGDPPTLLADSHKARSELNWIPRYPELETMIEHAWNAI